MASHPYHPSYSKWTNCIPNYLSIERLGSCPEASTLHMESIMNLTAYGYSKSYPEVQGKLEKLQLSEAIEEIERRKIEFLLSDETPLEEKSQIVINFASQKEKDRWEKRLVEGAEKIERKLSKQFEAAQRQMEAERDRSQFVYRQGRLNNLEHFFWQASDLGINVNFEIGVSFSTNVGHKHSLEDRYLVSSFSLKLKETSYPAQLFGVFDGHGGGPEAAIYARDNLQRLLERALQKLNPESLSNEGIWNALKIAFVETSQRIKGNSGTTATVILIINDQIWVPNAGDSRAILVTEEKVIRLSEDADPKDPRHAKSCEKRGGCISKNLLVSPAGGTLAMTRSLGDAPFFASSPRPENIAYPLSSVPRGSHIVLATDGLWHKASSRQVAKAVLEHSEESALNLTQNLLISARKAGSLDDITIVVIKFA